MTARALIPLVMVVLSVTLKDSINRWANIIVGIVFAGLVLVGLGEYLVKQDAYYAGLILIATVEFAVAALIVWHAWKWPKQIERARDPINKAQFPNSKFPSEAKSAR